MAGGFSYASLAPHNNSNAADDNRQPSPDSQHHAISPRSPGHRPVSPLDSEDDSSAHRISSISNGNGNGNDNGNHNLGRSFSTSKGDRAPLVEVHPVIAEEQAANNDICHQPGLYHHHESDKNNLKNPYAAYSGAMEVPGQDGGYDGIRYQATGDHNHNHNRDFTGHDAPYYTGTQQCVQPQPTQIPPTGSSPPLPGNNSAPPTYHIFSEWLWEIISLLLTYLLFMAIVLLLAFHNNRAVPNWGQYINLNTMLALLSTVFRASLVVVITQIISQRKWSWFAPTYYKHNAARGSGGGGKARPLGHIQKYDEGSRNSFMAIWLFVVDLKGRDVVALLAAVVFLLSFLVGPFVQQASQTLSCSTMMPMSANGTFSSSSSSSSAGQGGGAGGGGDGGLGSASVPYARYVPRTGGWKRGYPGSLGNPTGDTIVAILSSATAPRGIENKVSFTCTTGNCTFPDGDPLREGEEAARDVSLGMAQTNSSSSSSAATASSGDDGDNVSLPFLGNVIGSGDSGSSKADGYTADFLDSTHSTVGICRACSDISAAIAVTPAGGDNGTSTYGQGRLAGMNVTHGSFGTIFNMTSGTRSESQNLSWIPGGDDGIVSLEMRTASRYALQNTTLLLTSVAEGAGVDAKSLVKGERYLAAACNLYPCLRTFSSAVEGGQLKEVEAMDSRNTADPIRRAERQMWPAKTNATIRDVDEMDVFQGYPGSILTYQDIMYTAIKTPCRVASPGAGDGVNNNNAVLYTRENISTAPGAVDITMYQPASLDAAHAIAVGDVIQAYDNPDVRFRWVQHRAPEECVYRQANQFSMAVTTVLRDTVMSGKCTDDPRMGPLCQGTADAIESTMNALFGGGNATFQSIEAWFQDFADALTGRYRFQFGAAEFSANDTIVLPPGVLQGIAWQDEVCIAAHMQWLALPGVLLVITTGLFIWTVWRTWKHRHHRPVWKDSLLPMLFYNARFSQEGHERRHHDNSINKAFGHSPHDSSDLDTDVHDVSTVITKRPSDFHRATEAQARLLEAKEMQNIADRTMVTFDWPGTHNGSNSHVESGGDLSRSTGVLYDPHNYYGGNGPHGNNGADGYQEVYTGGAEGGGSAPNAPRRRPFFRLPWHQRLSADSLLDQNQHGR